MVSGRWAVASIPQIEINVRPDKSKFFQQENKTPGPGFQVELETRFAAQAQKPCA